MGILPFPSHISIYLPSSPGSPHSFNYPQPHHFNTMFNLRTSALFVVAIAGATVALPGGHAKPEHKEHAMDPQSYASSSSSSYSYVNASQVNKCNNVGQAQCCDSMDYATPEEMQSLLSFVNSPLTQETLVGHGCSSLTSADTTCNAQAVCCENSYQGIGVSCNNFAE